MKTNAMNTLKWGMALMTVAGLIGCQPNEKEKTKETIRVSASDKMSSDELTSSAEQLIGPYTFMLAHQMANMALEKDPTNVKAEFISKFTLRFEAFRGIHTRMRPLLKPDQIAGHERWVKEFPASPLKTFLMDSRGGAPLKTTTDIQNVVGDFYKGIKEFRQFLIDKQDSRIDLQINPHVFEQEIREELVDSCHVVQTPGQEYDYDVICNYEGIATKKMNAADFILLRQMAAGELIYGAMLNSYSLEGLETLEGRAPMSNKERAAYLAQLPKFGKLRADNAIVLLKSIGSDLSGALKWVARNQKELCPDENHDYYNFRKGYLFKDGICVLQDGSEDDVSHTIAFIDRALGGAMQMDVEDANGNLITTNLDVFAWSKNPVVDLRSIMPTTWNQCDKATALRDGTFGGIFVDNNANQFLDTSCE